MFRNHLWRASSLVSPVFSGRERFPGCTDSCFMIACIDDGWILYLGDDLCHLVISLFLGRFPKCENLVIMGENMCRSAGTYRNQGECSVDTYFPHWRVPEQTDQQEEQERRTNLEVIQDIVTDGDGKDSERDK